MRSRCSGGVAPPDALPAFLVALCGFGGPAPLPSPAGLLRAVAPLPSPARGRAILRVASIWLANAGLAMVSQVCQTALLPRAEG